MALQIRSVHRIYLLAIISTLCCMVASYGDGSPKSACNTLVPNHYGSKPQTSDSPYSISLVDVTSDGGAKGEHLFKDLHAMFGVRTCVHDVYSIKAQLSPSKLCQHNYTVKHRIIVTYQKFRIRIRIFIYLTHV